MHILICTGIFPPEIGGPATYSYFLMQALKKLGYVVTVITYSENNKVEDNVVYIKRNRFKLWHYYKYFQAVKRYGKEADVLYAQDAVSAGYPTYLAARVLKKQYALKITGDHSWEQAVNRGLTNLLIDEFQDETGYPWPISKMRETQIRVVKGAKRVIVPSLYLKSIVTGWGADPKKIEVIYNSVPPLNALDRHAERVKLGLKEEDFLILSVGRAVKWKGFELLLETVTQMLESNPNFKLVTLHDVKKEILHRYYAASDLFVLNTGYEGFSHTILEALSAGLPIITTRVGGNLELMHDGINGILIDYNNKAQLSEAIQEIYSNSELRKKLKDNARSTFTNFQLKSVPDGAMVEKTLEILQKCAS